MSQASLWWVLAGALVALELVSGTFYLLMLAIGVSAAALASHLGAPLATQLASAALIGGAAVWLWRLRQQRRPAAAPAASNPDLNQDLGAMVHVQAWDPDGQTQVRHRGANWQARLAPGSEPRAGRCRVVAVSGNQLVLQPA
ncbi:MAG: NfeD family protein [Rhodoferax sp.]|nr:NfeD family protein [Rhodoferax sp.]